MMSLHTLYGFAGFCALALLAYLLHALVCAEEF